MTVAEQLNSLEQSNLPVVFQKDISKTSVIILDDNDFDRRHVARILKSAGVKGNLCRVSTLREFQTEVEKGGFDVAIIDFNLSDGSGLDALQILRRLPGGRFVRPIMVAGEAQLEVAVQAMKDGCSDYLSKQDLSPERLRDAMKLALRHTLPDSQDEHRLAEQVQILMGVVNGIAIAEFRPRLSRILRLVRELRLSQLHEEQRNCSARLETTCLELLGYCKSFGDEVVRKAKSLH